MLPRPDPWARVKAFWRRIYEAETRPHALAMGVAVGLFFACMPIVGQALLAAILAVPLRANKAVAVGLTLLSNPLTLVPYLSFATWVGGLVLPTNDNTGEVIRGLVKEFHWERFLAAGSDILYPMLVGSFALAFGLSVPAYFLLRFVAERRTTRMRSIPK